jgi:hypothetical protein
MERLLSCHGKSALSVPRLTLKLSFLKREAQLAKQSESVCHAMYAQSVWNTRSHMTRDLVSGADYPSENAADSNAAQHKFSLFFNLNFPRFAVKI